MATIYWKSAVGGDWGTAADWSGGMVPDAGSTVIINPLGVYNVTISSAAAALSLNIEAAGATIFDNNTLAIGSALTVTAGILDLNPGGRIVGGTLSATGGTFVWNGGVVSGITYDGVLNIATANSLLYVTSAGLVAHGGNGSGNGTINVSGGFAALAFQDSQTFNNATINIGGAIQYAYIAQVDIAGSNGVLTLGSGLTINQTGAASLESLSNKAGDAIINNGLINAGWSNGQFAIYNLANFTNNRTITVTNGSTLTVDSSDFTNAAGASIAATAANLDFDGPTFSNSGAISVSGGNAIIGSRAVSWLNAGTITFAAGSTGSIGSGNSASWVNTGTISVASGATLDVDGAYSTKQLESIINNGGTIGIDGSLNNTGATLTVGAGSAFPTLTLTGTISGGTIADPGSAVVFAGGTLSGVIYDGALDLSAAGSALGIGDGGLIAHAASGTGNGVILDTGNRSELEFDDTQEIDNATIDLGNSAYFSYLLQQDVTGANGTLTLGSGLTIVQTGADAMLESASREAGDAMINQGTINGAYNGGDLIIAPINLTNQGEITASNGDTVVIGNGGGNFTNASTGSILVSGAGTTAAIEGTWTNAGSMTVGSGAELRLGGFFDTADVLGITNNGGIVGLDGELTNAGAVLAVGTGAVAGTLVLENNGDVVGGTITNSGAGLVFDGGAVSGVTYEGVLDLSATGARLYVLSGGLTVETLTGGANGTIVDTGAGSAIVFGDTQTFNNATIDIGNSAQVSWLGQVDLFGPPGILTLGSGVVINQTGALAGITSSDEPGGGVVNDGAINATFGGGTFLISPIDFTNNGSITVANGDTLTIATVQQFTNLSGGALTRGSYEVDAGSTFNLDPNSKVSIDRATIILSGAGSVIQSLNTTTNKEVAIEAQLTAVGVGAKLEVLAGRNWASGLSITNSGTIVLGGGTFTAASLTNNGTLSGFGAVAGGLKNSATLSVQAGDTLNLTGATLSNLSGNTLTGGIYTVAAGGTLQLANNAFVTTLNATVDLAGVGAAVQSLNTATSAEVNLSATLTAIGTSGRLDVLGAANYSSANTLANSGLIDLGGGTLTTGLLTGAAGSVLEGFGTVASSVNLSGSVIASGQAITFTGTGDVFSGGLNGGLINFAGGSQTINAGATLSVANLQILGGTTTINASVSDANSFNMTQAATLSLSKGATFTIANASLAGLLEGAGTLSVGNLSFNGLTVGGTAVLNVTGTATQFSSLTIGDATTAVASLTIATGAVYSIEAAVGIARGHAVNSSLRIGGTLIKFTAGGTSAISLLTYDNGLIEAADGTLDFTFKLLGAGSLKIDAGATLELGSSAASTLTAQFNGANATLALRFARSFAATITGLASTDTIDLLRTRATGASVNASDQLVIVNGATTVATLKLSGSYAGATFTIGSDGNGGTNVTLAGAGASFISTMAAMGARASTAGLSAAAQPAPPPIPPLLSPHT